jgi:putative addiction module component (TIGR02574 family)
MQPEEIIMPGSKEILKKALELPPSEKAQLIDKLLSSLDKPDRDIDELWAKEAEDRIDAYEKEKLRALSIKEVLAKYR